MISNTIKAKLVSLMSAIIEGSHEDATKPKRKRIAIEPAAIVVESLPVSTEPADDGTAAVVELPAATESVASKPAEQGAGRKTRRSGLHEPAADAADVVKLVPTATESVAESVAAKPDEPDAGRKKRANGLQELAADGKADVVELPAAKGLLSRLMLTRIRMSQLSLVWLLCMSRLMSHPEKDKTSSRLMLTLRRLWASMNCQLMSSRLRSWSRLYDIADESTSSTTRSARSTTTLIPTAAAPAANLETSRIAPTRTSMH